MSNRAPAIALLLFLADALDCAPLSRGVSAPAGPIGPTLEWGDFNGHNLRWARATQGHVSHLYRAVV